MRRIFSSAAAAATLTIALGAATPTAAGLGPGGRTQVTNFGEVGPQSGAGALADFTLLKESVAVPEPASWALMISGSGMAGAIPRQRRRIAA
jgi:hypothetical protein